MGQQWDNNENNEFISNANFRNFFKVGSINWFLGISEWFSSRLLCRTVVSDLVELTRERSGLWEESLWLSIAFRRTISEAKSSGEQKVINLSKLSAEAKLAWTLPRPRQVCKANSKMPENARNHRKVYFQNISCLRWIYRTHLKHYLKIENEE